MCVYIFVSRYQVCRTEGLSLLLLLLFLPNDQSHSDTLYQEVLSITKFPFLSIFLSFNGFRQTTKIIGFSRVTHAFLFSFLSYSTNLWLKGYILCRVGPQLLSMWRRGAYRLNIVERKRGSKGYMWATKTKQLT
uniref:Putative secreted protein n=1 Tax=Anopheles darlingi TaxID=43151 RepID=A0A2M4DMZ9_ANODA